MRIPIDTTTLTFIAGSDPRPVLDMEGRPRADKATGRSSTPWTSSPWAATRAPRSGPSASPASRRASARASRSGLRPHRGALVDGHPPRHHLPGERHRAAGGPQGRGRVAGREPRPVHHRPPSHRGGGARSWRSSARSSASSPGYSSSSRARPASSRSRSSTRAGEAGPLRRLDTRPHPRERRRDRDRPRHGPCLRLRCAPNPDRPAGR